MRPCELAPDRAGNSVNQPAQLRLPALPSLVPAGTILHTKTAQGLAQMKPASFSGKICMRAKSIHMAEFLLPQRFLTHEEILVRVHHPGSVLWLRTMPSIWRTMMNGCSIWTRTLIEGTTLSDVKQATDDDREDTTDLSRRRASLN